MARPVNPGGGELPPIPPNPQEELEVGEETGARLNQLQWTVNNGIRNSSGRRDEKLSPERRAALALLQRELVTLGEYSMERVRLEDRRLPLMNNKWHLEDLRDKDDPSFKPNDYENIVVELRNLKPLRAAAERQLEEFIQHLLEQYNDQDLLAEHFSDWRYLHEHPIDRREIQIEFMKEQLLNRCANPGIFKASVEALVEQKKMQLIAEFSDWNLEGLNPDNVKVTVNPIGSETHRGGKVPAEILFQHTNGQEFRVFFKPRKAEVDRAIIALFGAINALSDERSSNVNLPTYKIIESGEGEEPYSFWEHIPGDHKPGSAADLVVEAMEDSDEKIALQGQLMRLESICRRINLSDLHQDNVIFSEMGTERARIVPIDLESIQRNAPTGLYRKGPELPDLSEQERELLERFNREILDTPIRLVIISTSRLEAALRKCDSHIELAKDMMEQLSDCIIEATLGRLEELILKDILQNDIPYLEERGAKVYYVGVSERHVIARRNT